MSIDGRRNHEAGGFAVIAGDGGISIVVCGIGIDHNGIAVFPACVAIAARPAACHIARAARRVIAPAAASTAAANRVVVPVFICISRTLGDKHAVLIVMGNADGAVLIVEDLIFQGDRLLNDQLGAAFQTVLRIQIRSKVRAFLRRCVILIGLDLQLGAAAHRGICIGFENRQLCYAELCFEADLEGRFRNHGERLCLEITDEPEAVASARAHAELLVPTLYAAERAAQLHVVGNLEAADAGNAPVDKCDVVDVADAGGRDEVPLDLVGHVHVIRQLHISLAVYQTDFIGNRNVFDFGVQRKRHRIAKLQFLLAAQRNALG